MTTAYSASASVFDRVLRWADIRVHAFRALLRAYVLMDFRSQQFGRATATGPKALITPLFWVVGQYLLLNGALSVVLFARVDAFFFALITLGTSMLVVATSVIVEFNEVVLDTRDLEVIGHHPLPVRTYSAARTANLLGYVLLMTASLNVFPAIVGVGLRDTGWTFLPVYALAALLGNLAVVGAIVLLYTVLLRGRPGEGAREVLAWTQIILIMVAVYGGQAVFRDSQSRLEMAAYSLPAWVMALPPAWLAQAVDSFGPGRLEPAWWILALGVLVAVGVWVAAIWRLSVEYARMQPGSSGWRRVTLPRLPQPGSLLGPMMRFLLRSREEAAAFWLCSTMLWRDHDLRMRSWPSLGVVVALLVLGLFSGQLGDPLAEPGRGSILSIACLYLLVFPLPTIAYNLNFSRDHSAAWLLRSAPLADGAGFAEGIRKAISYRLLLPLLLVLFVVYGLVWRDLGHALLHLVVGWLIIVGGGHATQIGIVRSLPFSRPLARGGTMGSIALFAGIVNGFAMLLAAVHYLAVESSGGFAVYLGGLVLLVLGLRWMARRATSRRFAAVMSYE